MQPLLKRLNYAIARDEKAEERDLKKLATLDREISERKARLKARLAGRA
jgi:hypothetical protein